MVDETSLPGYRGPMQPMGQYPKGHVFADKKQSGVLAKIMKSHMRQPKRPAPRRKGRSQGRSKTIEADNKAHFNFGQKGVFY